MVKCFFPSRKAKGKALGEEASGAAPASEASKWGEHWPLGRRPACVSGTLVPGSLSALQEGRPGAAARWAQAVVLAWGLGHLCAHLSVTPPNRAWPAGTVLSD